MVSSINRIDYHPLLIIFTQTPYWSYTERKFWMNLGLITNVEWNFVIFWKTILMIFDFLWCVWNLRYFSFALVTMFFMLTCSQLFSTNLQAISIFVSFFRIVVTHPMWWYCFLGNYQAWKAFWKLDRFISIRVRWFMNNLFLYQNLLFVAIQIEHLK